MITILDDQTPHSHPLSLRSKGTRAPLYRFLLICGLVWTEKHGVDLDTPLLLFNPRLRCRRCNRRQVKITAEPYSNHPKADEAALRAAREGGFEVPTMWVGQCQRLSPSSSAVRLGAAVEQIYALHNQNRMRLPQLWELVDAAEIVRVE